MATLTVLILNIIELRANKYKSFEQGGLLALGITLIVDMVTISLTVLVIGNIIK